MARGDDLPLARGGPGHARRDRWWRATGSELVFDYVDQAVLDSLPHQGATGRARSGVAAAGEPWISGFDPAQLRDDLDARGWELIANLGAEELNTRYCAGRTDGLTPSLGAYMAHARVAP